VSRVRPSLSWHRIRGYSELDEARNLPTFSHRPPADVREVIVVDDTMAVASRLRPGLGALEQTTPAPPMAMPSPVAASNRRQARSLWTQLLRGE
jgi:hypothetical protein